MKYLLILLLSLTSASVLAQPAPPVISRNVHVIPNSTVKQCEAYEGGKVGPEENVQTNTAAGSFGDEATAGVRSCSGCRIDGQSGDCVCDSCYDYFN